MTAVNVHVAVCRVTPARFTLQRRMLHCAGCCCVLRHTATLACDHADVSTAVSGQFGLFSTCDRFRASPCDRVRDDGQLLYLPRI